MLAEIEEKLVKVLQEKLVEVPKENIVVDAKPTRLPAVVISNLEFKFDNGGLTENLDQGNIEIEETFNSDGVKTSYRLKEKPLKRSLHVESPPGTLLSSKEYSVNYDHASVELQKAPAKGMKQIFVRYSLQKRIMTLKSLKVEASYTFDVLSRNRLEADSLAEKVVKALLILDSQVLGKNVEIKPLGGISSFEEDGKTAKVRLKFVVETEIRVEQVVGLMKQIDITRKNI
jgi:hypothetical protein